MRSLNVVWITLTLSSFLPQTMAQFAQCIQKCIDQNTSQSCQLADFPCICRQSSGNFLPNVVVCVHNECDNNLDSSVFIAPLSLICQIAGAPLPASAVSSAQNEASSLAAQPATVTATVTQGGGEGAVPTSSATISGAYTTTTSNGQTFILSGSTTSTFFGSSSSSLGTSTASTGTSSPSSGFIGFIPIFITTTNSAGSTYTSTTSRPGTVSTYTTTDSRGATVVQASTYTQSPTSATGQVSSSASQSSSVSSSVAAGASSLSRSSSRAGPRTSTIFLPEKTTAGSPSGTSTAGQGSSTDSAPFTNTNTGSRDEVGSWLGLSVCLAVIAFWV